MCSPVNFAKFLRTPFSTEHLRWLLLEIIELTENVNSVSMSATRQSLKVPCSVSNRKKWKSANKKEVQCL